MSKEATSGLRMKSETIKLKNKTQDDKTKIIYIKKTGTSKVTVDIKTSTLISTLNSLCTCILHVEV